jgi:heat shock protein HslJ
MVRMNISLYLIPALALPILAACQTIPTPEEPAQADQVYTARGNEPGWILKMDSKTIDYQGDYGETKIKIAAPEGRPSFNGMRYVTDRLTVDVTYASCTDDMSGKRFADTVTVMADGKQVKGCGGRALPPESLNHTTWIIAMIDQFPVLEAIPTEVRFADGRVSGTAGCNRFNGTYDVASNALTFGPMASTRMICPEKQMAQEAKFLALLSGKVTKRYSVEGNLILADDKGNRATLRQVL